MNAVDIEDSKIKSSLNENYKKDTEYYKINIQFNFKILQQYNA